MESISSAGSEQLSALLARYVEDHRTDLIARYLTVLREALFSSRAEVRPSALKSLAAEEVEVLLQFLRQPEFSAAARGEQLHQVGFSVGAILKLGQVTRQSLLKASEDHQIASLLEIVDTYELVVVQGFVQSIDNTNRMERAQLERVLTALRQHGEN